MQRFARLYTELDQTNKTNDKVRILKDYFADVPDDDKLWALALFTGRRPKRQINRTQLWTWSLELSGIPSWLFHESYSAVGDLAEAISLLLPEPQQTQDRTLTAWIEVLQGLPKEEEEERKRVIQQAWQAMTQQERLVFTKLMTGAFRLGVSSNLVIRALSELYDLAKPVLSHRLMGSWLPGQCTWDELIFGENKADDLSRPYPFFLAHQLDDEPQSLGEPHEWQVEWKWDGIRSQTIKRGGHFYIWSRGEDLITERMPELHVLQDSLPPGTVIDGEVLPFKNNRPQPFSLLQTRIGRKNLSQKVLKEAPVVIFAYDLLEFFGKDIREKPLEERRQLLEKVVQEANVPQLQLSPVVEFSSWQELVEKREESRSRFAEGFMLKRLNSPYQVGRKRGDWWKWKVDPLTMDAVLIYAQRGTGKRAIYYTDYTFGVWNEGQLIPFAKAYSGLTDAEIRQVDAFVKKHTKEKFGPVRTVKPELVFEIAFEGLQESKRHKSGVAVRFPRIQRWRHDKNAEDANTLEELQELLEAYQKGLL